MQNREIKFRAWDKQDKRMIVHEQKFIPLLVTSSGVFRLSPTHDGHIYSLMPADRFDLMQFSGLHDKNGKEIYEGDIRVAKYYCGDEEVITYNTMVWDKEYACFSWEGREIPDWADNGVIGNLYENPDLIK